MLQTLTLRPVFVLQCLNEKYEAADGTFPRVSVSLSLSADTHSFITLMFSDVCAVGCLERILLRKTAVPVQNTEGLPHPGHHPEPGARVHLLRRAQEVMSLTTAPVPLHAAACQSRIS